MSIEATYQQIAENFRQCVVRGNVDTDELLLTPAADTRRSLTLLLRPDPAVIEQLNRSCQPIRALTGEQYAQPFDELHTTVISVLPGIPDYHRHKETVPVCIQAVAEAVADLRDPVRIDYRGIIGSNDSLLVKGYPAGSALQKLRESIVAKLTELGIEQRLQRRYVMTAAHMTLVRFTSQPSSLQKLDACITELAQTPFGTTTATSLELVECDWYMRRQNLRELKRFPLG